MRIFRMGVVVILLLSTTHAVTQAQPLRFSFTDPAGDQPAMIPDVVGLDFTLDPGTGDYEIVLTADAAAPFAPTAPAFLGPRINLFNADLGVTTQDPSFFSLIADLQLSDASTSLTLTGTNARLTTWGLGDRVAIDSVLGNPDGIGLFSSSVRVVQDRAIIGSDTIAPGGVATIALIPEPAAAVLLCTFIAIVVAGGFLRPSGYIQGRLVLRCG